MIEATAGWAIWLALSALIVALGKFLDDYHISNQRRTKVQQSLTKAFVLLDEMHIADFGRKLADFVYRAGRKLGWKWVLIFFVGLELLQLVLVWLQTGGLDEPFSVEGFVFAAQVTFLLWSAIPLFGAIGAVLTFVFAKWTSTSRSAFGPIFWACLGSVVVAFVLFVGLGVVGAMSGPYGMMIAVVVMVPLYGPFIAISAAMVALLLLRTFLLLIRRLFMVIFDAASNPVHSPFAYASALLGIAVLATKVIKELL